jgi:alanyl-tRNA synthetase
MVQFKNVFTGAESALFARGTSQKCVRAGGKHNDLDNVGYTARHHTFFEMLGNFSFGDYFKEQRDRARLDADHQGSRPAEGQAARHRLSRRRRGAGLWKKIAGLPTTRSSASRPPTISGRWATPALRPVLGNLLRPRRPHPGGPPGIPDEDGDRFVEIWNLVFMQFEQFNDGTRVSLPKPSIDTGMGLERIAAVLQGVHDNYDTDLFRR